MQYEFDSRIQLGGIFGHSFDTTTLKNEPMFFNSSDSYAYDHGGSITRAFLNQFYKENPTLAGKCVFDSRVHMLMPGWFPCIPGYHHDDVPRDRNDGQPEYDNPSYRSNHAIGLVNAEIAATQFALGKAVFPKPAEGKVFYEVWHNQVEDYLNQGKLNSFSAPDRTIVYFDDRAWHQGTQAISDGWRWFGRLSWNTNRIPTNEIRKQVQVYLSNPMMGW